MKDKGDFTKEHSFTNNTEIVSGASKDMEVQHSQPTDTSTNEKRPGECDGLSGMDTATFQNGHHWIKMIESIENKRIESIRKEKNDRIREKLKDQIKRVLLSNDENVTNENTGMQVLPKNCQLYRFVCPKCCKKFRQRGSLKKHTKANACPSQPFACIYCNQ